METPVGEKCLLCDDPIEAGDQGIVTPFCDVINGLAVTRLVAEHLDCFLDAILPHGPDCKRCRGLERGSHSSSCFYRTGEGECSCGRGKLMERLLDPRLTLAEADVIAKELGVERDYLLDLVRHRRTRRKAHERALSSQ